MEWRGNLLSRYRISFGEDTLSRAFDLFSNVVILHIFCLFNSLAKDCGIVKIPLNGSLVGPNRTTFSNSLTFTCDKGFVLKGSRVRHCQANATWSGKEAYCQGSMTVCLFLPKEQVMRQVFDFLLFL